MIEPILFDKFSVVYEGNQIKVKSKMTGIREEDSLLDSVTRCISDKVKYAISGTEELLSYWCYEETSAASIFTDINNLKTKEKEIDDKPKQIDKKAVVDTRITKELDDAFEITLDELLKIKLNLPSYQRPYRWGRKNIEFFWTDIRTCEETYDYGTIVLLKRDGGYDIVDGQQRIVTLSLMLRSLLSDATDSFINNTTLQGKDSEKNIGYNLQWFRRESRKLSDEERPHMRDKILKGTMDVIVMDDLDDALKFFDRTNTTGVPLTPTDILKSYHLQVLSSMKELSPQAKERWKDSGFNLDNIDEFKKEVVRKWESLDPWFLNKRLSKICALRLMSKGEYSVSMDEITDIEQFRKGDNKEGVYTGLDSPMADGEFFFWYVFKVSASFEGWEKNHAACLNSLLCSWRAQEMFSLLVVYIEEKYGKVDEQQYNKVLDLIFSWLVYLCLYYDALQFATIKNSAIKEGSVFKAITTGKSIEDCFDCYSENPYEMLKKNGWDERLEGNGVKYLIRRELRRIYGEDDKNM